MFETIKKLIAGKTVAHINSGNGELTAKMAEYAKNIAGFEYDDNKFKAAMKSYPKITFFKRKPQNPLDFSNIDVCVCSLSGLGSIERDIITKNSISTLSEQGIFIGILSKQDYDNSYDVIFKDTFKRFIIKQFNDDYLAVAYKKPLVSVVIPTFNNAKYIKDALDSVISQTYKSTEIIVVDDCSTDNTQEIISKYPQISAMIWNTKNMGIGYSREIGLEAATGDYICFLSADDMFIPDFIEQNIKNYKGGFNYSDYYLMNDEGKVTHLYDTGNFKSYDAFIIAVSQAAENYTMFVNYDTIFASKEVWMNNKFNPEMRYGEDYEHLLKSVLVKKVKFNCIKIPLVRYRLHKENTTSQRIDEIQQNDRAIIKRIFGTEHLF